MVCQCSDHQGYGTIGLFLKGFSVSSWVIYSEKLEQNRLKNSLKI